MTNNRKNITFVSDDIVFIYKNKEIKLSVVVKKLENKLSNSQLLTCVGICLTVALAVPVNVTFNSYRELEKQTQTLKDQTQTLKEQNIVIREQDKELSLLKERLAVVETKITR